MTYLELLQKLHRDCGAAGTQPATVLNLTGEARRLADYIKDANFDIQTAWTNWKFLREQDSRALTPSVNTLAAPADLGSGRWDEDTFRIIRVGDTVEEPLQVFEYDKVKGEQVDTSPGTPWRAVIMDDNSLRFEGTPNAADTFQADYFREPDRDELVANASESSIPERFHLAIIGSALIKYAEYEGAEEIRTKGLEMLNTHLPRLEDSQLPNEFQGRFRTGAKFQVTAR